MVSIAIYTNPAYRNSWFRWPLVVASKKLQTKNSKTCDSLSLKTNLKFIWQYGIPANKRFKTIKTNGWWCSELPRGIIEDYPLLQIKTYPTLIKG